MSFLMSLFCYIVFYGTLALWPISYEAKMIVGKMLKAKILDTNQTRTEINETGDRKITERTSEANCWFYEKINKIHNSYRHTLLLYFTLLCFADSVLFVFFFTNRRFMTTLCQTIQSVPFFQQHLLISCICVTF